MIETERRQALIFPRQQHILKILGENIKLARKRRELTQQLIAERTGLSRTTIRKVEQGNPGVSIGHYLVVLATLNLAEDLALVAQDDEFGRKLQDAKLLGTWSKS
ncbi:helix-turn-helix domain-containing protein [Candidatus Venteria ishoeyi]|uniref:Anaerobic benzoate catabolism transcriptional regulator n=1 Tax=Candidatus Venteria ishoeyi TaxID=1899563 RepID=A0A1H6FE00_9GAMM|nr:helix-turn-helix domain-containing protein [Candidatus Venteria ishoeyi]SEH08292.1 anaerobic benzoate catabolism transcriptional regulator [Candidatus Venteria ishoeyi]